MPAARKIIIGSLRATVLASVVLVGPMVLITLVEVLNNVDVVPPFEPMASTGIQCVKVQGNNSVESLGDLITRNQLAFYVANLYHAKVSFPSSKGTEREFTKHFSNCLMPHQACVLKHKDVGYLKCPRGDCGCLALNLSTYLHPLSDCSVLGVENFGRSSSEYSGCMGDVLRRYFGEMSRWPRPYDAVYFVEGAHEPDLANIIDGKVFAPDRFRHLMHDLCVLSERDIIVVTEGTPKIPVCKNRTVLANTTVLQAVKIMQHARHCSVGSNSLGILMMEMATPERVVLLSEVYKKYVWLRIPLITLVRKDGHMFHFSGRESLGDVEMELEKQKFDSEPMEVLTKPRIPVRRWEHEAESF